MPSYERSALEVRGLFHIVLGAIGSSFRSNKRIMRGLVSRVERLCDHCAAGQ